MREGQVRRREGFTYFSHPHAVGIRVPAEEDHNEALLLAEDGLVDVPATPEVRQKDRPHLAASDYKTGRMGGFGYEDGRRRRAGWEKERARPREDRALEGGG